MPTPVDLLVAEMAALLDDHLREDFEERAGIIEFDGKLSRAHAECLGLLDVLRRYPAVLTGVTALQIDQGGAPGYLLTTNLLYARQRLAALGGVEKGVLQLADVVEMHYGSVALLAAVG